MEIQKWLYCIVVNFVLIASSAGKSVSLNEVIAAESQIARSVDTTPATQPTDNTSKRYSLAQRIASKLRGVKARNSDTTGRYKKILLTPLSYKKTFKITSPLRPKRLNLRLKRKNQSTKREINEHEELKHKNFPLLKSLSMLFDNLLNSDGHDSYEIQTKKYKRNRYYADELFETSSHESDFRKSEVEFKPKKKTTTSTPPANFEPPIKIETFTLRQATTAPTHSSTTPYFSTIRPHKNIPVLLPRDTISLYRNYNGIGPRGSPAFHRNVQRNISGNNGDNEYHTGRQYKANTESYEQDAYDVARDSTSGAEYRRTAGHRNTTRHTEHRNTNTITNKTKSQATNDTVRKIQFEMGRHETASKISVPKSFGRLRGYQVSDNEISDKAKSLQSKEVYEERDDNVSLNNTSTKGIADEGSGTATKVQKVRTRNETMILFGKILNITKNDSTPTQNKSPVVMIYDGYSVTRHKNGQNKLSEKSFRIHS